MSCQDAEGTRNLRIEEPSEELDELAHRVIGAAIEVHRHVGPGFLESIYEQALSVELTLRNVAFARHEIAPIWWTPNRERMLPGGPPWKNAGSIRRNSNEKRSAR